MAEDLRQWSCDAQRAFVVHKAFLAEFERQLACHPDAREQFEAAASVAVRQLARTLRQHPHQTDQQRAEMVRAFWKTTERVALVVARRQQQRRAAAGQTLPALRSVMDGWRWRGGGRPGQNVTLLLLRVEVWRDMRARERPAEGRVSRAAALAAVLVADWKESDPATYKGVDRVRRRNQNHDQDQGHAPLRALTGAVMKVKGKYVRSLQARFSQALTSRPLRGRVRG